MTHILVRYRTMGEGAGEREVRKGHQREDVATDAHMRSSCLY